MTRVFFGNPLTKTQPGDKFGQQNLWGRELPSPDLITRPESNKKPTDATTKGCFSTFETFRAWKVEPES